MIIGHPQRILHTYEVIQEEPPQRGQRYVDPRGVHWTVRGVTREVAVLRDPPAEAPVWDVELESNHPFYRLNVGEELRMVFRADEIADRRSTLTVALQGIPNFMVVGVTDDGFSLVANFSGPVSSEAVPSIVDGMPVVIRVIERSP